MPQRRASIKALRQNHTKKLHNLDITTALKKVVKKYITAVKSGNETEAKDSLKVAYKKIDKAAKVKIINKNTAARKKSRLSRLLVRKAS